MNQSQENNTNTKTLKHDAFCEHPELDYLSSGCEDFCDYRKAETADCVAIGEHFKRIVSVQGQDLCFNCGGKS